MVKILLTSCGSVTYSAVFLCITPEDPPTFSMPQTMNDEDTAPGPGPSLFCTCVKIVPQGRVMIAHRFNGGYNPETTQTPQGRKKAATALGAFFSSLTGLLLFAALVAQRSIARLRSRPARAPGAPGITRIIPSGQDGRTTGLGPRPSTTRICPRTPEICAFSPTA